MTSKQTQNNSTEAAYKEAKALYHAHGKVPKAIRTYEHYLQLAPADDNAWSELGTLYQSRDAISDALRCYNEAIALDKSASQYWDMKAGLLANLNHAQIADMTHLRHLKDSYKAHFATLTALRETLLTCYQASLELKKADTGSIDISILSRIARLHTDLGQHRKAIAAYEQLQQLDDTPRKQSNYIFFSALAYEKLGEWDQALANIAACETSRDDIVLTHKARILRAADREEEALITYHLFLDKIDKKIEQRQDTAYYFQKAGVLESLGRNDDAVTCLREMLKNAPRITPKARTHAQQLIDTFLANEQ